MISKKSRFFKFIDIYYLMKKMLDNTAILMIPGLPLWVEIHYDFGDEFSQQFPSKIAGMALGLPAVIEAIT